MVNVGILQHVSVVKYYGCNGCGIGLRDIGTY
jgi:hypothetical protein